MREDILGDQPIPFTREAIETGANDAMARRALLYDFRRPDRIAKDQLRAIQLVHENFTRTLGSSLSAYLRAYVSVGLISVEQISFQEFLHALPSPTCLVSLGMRQFDTNALLELSPSVVFPILETLLGSTVPSSGAINREITEIEQSILDGVVRIILRDLREAWGEVVAIEFDIDTYEAEPQLLQILAPNEAVVSISIEVRIGELMGRLNIAVPSITIKMLGQKFDQQWHARKSEATEQEQERLLHLIRNAGIQLDTRLRGPSLSVENLLKLNAGDVLTFDYPVSRPLDLEVNGKLKFRGQIVANSQRRSILLQEMVSAQD